MRKRRPRFCDAELLLLLRSYEEHPCNWKDIIATMKDNLTGLPASTISFYEQTSDKALQERLTAKLGKLMLIDLESLNDDVR